MDKYEYKVRAEEIRTLIEERKYPEAMAIADTIDWRKVKSVSMLCDISDLYNVNRKFDVARDVLELAYERHPEGRRIVYSLCELSIKMEDIIQAVEYYKEFVKIAPRDSGRYILQYKIYQAQEVGIDECIAVLKELKKRDYREKWAYELAYLYHRSGLATECVEECDELILWFGEGTFVKKAMELKMLHSPLTATQKEKYDLMNGRMARREAPARAKEPEIRVKPVDTSIYNTMNLQKELAMSLEAVLKKDQEELEPVVAVHNTDTGAIQVDEVQSQFLSRQEPVVNEYENINVIDLMDEGEARNSEPEIQNTMGDTRVFNPSDISRFSKLIPDDPVIPTLEPVTTVNLKEELKKEEPVKEFKEEFIIEKAQEPVVEEPEVMEDEETTIFVEEAELEKGAPTVNATVQPEAPSGFEELLSQEYDGQISLVVPEEEPLEKQITGQLSIEDVLAEWERMKRENEQKRQDEVRQRVLEHTGNLMKDFDETVHEELKDFEELVVEDEPSEESVEDIQEESLEEAALEEMLQEEPSEEEEDTFEELEEIIEDDEEENSDNSLGMKAVAGAAAVGAGVLAAGITAEASKGEASLVAGAEVAGEVAKDALGVAGTVLKGVANVAGDLVEAAVIGEPEAEEPKKTVPYGANRFEYEEETEEQLEVEKPVKRVVQDYNELLYGEDFVEESTLSESVSDALESKEEVSEENILENEIFQDENLGDEISEETAQNQVSSEESLEEFDPQNFMNNLFETEDYEADTTSENVEKVEEQTDVEEYDLGFDFSETVEQEESDDLSQRMEALVSKVFQPEEDSTPEEETSETEEEYLPVEDYLQPEEESTPEEEISETGEEYLPVEDYLQPEEESTPEEDTSETGEEYLPVEEFMQPEESMQVEEALEEQDTMVAEEYESAQEPVQTTEIVTPVNTIPKVEYVPSEEPLADTFTIVTPEMQQQMLQPQVLEPQSNEMIETEQATVNQEAVLGEFVQETAMEQPVMEEPVYGETEAPEQIYNEDQYAKALEEQLSSVMPESFSAIDESSFERIENIMQPEQSSSYDEFDTLSEETEPPVENFYERQAEIERTRVSRPFTEAEERLYGGFLRTKKAKDQLIYAIDNISMASYTGNIIITGDDQKENLELARNLLKEVQQNDDNFSGVPGKISADSLNRKEVDSILQKVENGAVIIENAGALSKETVEDMTGYLEKENRGIIVILLDHKMNMDKMLSANPALRSNFNARIDIEEMTSQELSAYGKSYAYEKEYAIDEMGMLALFTRIEELQTRGHVVMPEEVERIVDAAIKKANRKNVKHFTDIILNKRYDEEDMIVLREKDF